MHNIDKLIERTKDLTLLYVEDNEDTRESTIIILNHLFDNVIVAIDGEDGLLKYTQNPKIDLIISDICMPKMDGLDMSREIKKINKNQSIIILTAIVEIQVIKDAIDIGIDSFISKPLENIEVLFDKIEKSTKEIEYEKQEKELKIKKYNKEKVELIIKLIDKLSHHCKEPLSIISSVSSDFGFKIENNIGFVEKDYEDITLVTKKSKELSNIFEQLETLDFENITLEEIEKLIYINNPICENK